MAKLLMIGTLLISLGTQCSQNADRAPVAKAPVRVVRVEKPQARHVRQVRVTATAYSPGCRIQRTGWRTATGRNARLPGVAVDPKVIPLGSRVYIPGYGWRLADDTGGAIKGRRIDLRLPSRGECLRFGRQKMTVAVEAGR